MTPSASLAQQALRDPSQLEWYVVPLGVLVVFLYGEQAAHKRWAVFHGGLAFWFMDWLNEIANSLFFHFTGFAPLWGTPTNSAFVILIGLNIEICFMFAVLGLASMRLLPADPSMRIAGIRNRWFIAALLSAIAVGIELLLNRAGMLTWDWPYWRAEFPWFIFLEGYLPFFIVGFWVHDLAPERRMKALAGLGGSVAASLVVFGPILGWL
jgi:hypothetical protein